MAQDKIVLLGTKGGPRLTAGSSWPSSSVLELSGKSYVIDCGIGVSRQFVEAGYLAKDLRAILITHHHSDHNLELGPFLYTCWTSGPVERFDIYGPPGLHALLDNFFASQLFDLEIRMKDEQQSDIRELIHASEFTEGEVFADDQVRVTALRVPHPPIEHCYALKFTTEDKTIVFSADTCFFPPLAEFARGADVLVHEVMHRTGIDALCKRLAEYKPNLREHLVASHTYAEDVGRIATMAGVGHLVLNHFVPSDDPSITPDHFAEATRETWQGKLTVGHDLAVIEV